MPLSTYTLRASARFATRVILPAALSVTLFLPTALHNTTAIDDANAVASPGTSLSHTVPSLTDAIAERSAADAQAVATIASATATASAVGGKTDVAPLAAAINTLHSYRSLNVSAERHAIQTTATAAVATAAAAAAAAADQAAAAAAAAALAAANTPDGARATAQNLAATDYGWDASQFQCLDQLWTKESGWSYTANNTGSGAAGIPQALPGSKMASAGADWATNAATQIGWGLGYIARSYGTPCAAWAHSESVNWY